MSIYDDGTLSSLQNGFLKVIGTDVTPGILTNHDN